MGFRAAGRPLAAPTVYRLHRRYRRGVQCSPAEGETAVHSYLLTPNSSLSEYSEQT